jgi:hypothetical protein
VTCQAGIPPTPTHSLLSNFLGLAKFLYWDYCSVVLCGFICHSSFSLSGIETRDFNHTLWYSLFFSCGILIFLISTDSLGSLYYFFGWV